jgi:hypothetical protein
LSAEGATHAAVLSKLQEQLRIRLSSFAELLSVDVADLPVSGNPWVEYAGMFKNDPYFDEWQSAIAENRQRIETESELFPSPERVGIT